MRENTRARYVALIEGSTWECWAHTDSLVDFWLVPPEAVAEVRNLQNQITALLITTIRDLEDRHSL